MKDNKKILYLAAVLFSVIYLVWRLFFTLPLSGSLFALIFGIALWISEVVSNFTAFILIWSKSKEKMLEKPIVENEEYPHVDVIIATHNEDVELLYKTVNGCVHMEYPDPSKVHIYLSDDTNRKEVKELAKQFNVGYAGFENNKHAKSGNLNNALRLTNSPLVATFDADMIPYSKFLMETVPYFMEDFRAKDDPDRKHIGFIQTPQSFYNADIFQYNLFSENSIANEQDFFSKEVNVLNNAHDTAIYTGSNTLILRKAIEVAGGFPTNTITEDFQLGAKINSCGYRSISTLEPMASGLTPSDFQSVLKQRIRWARGVIRSIYNLRILTNPDFNWNQKMVFLNSYLYWWSFFRRLLYVFAPILFTVFDIRVVDTDFWVLMCFWLPGYFLLQRAMTSVSGEIRSQRWGEIQETIFAPYLVVPVFLESIGITEKKFKVTKKTVNRSRYELLYVVPHLIMLLLSLYGLIKFNYGKFGSELLYGSVITFWLLHHTVNLSYAVLFSLGRPIYRKFERFYAKEALTVTYLNHEYSLYTTNISEEGLSFFSEEPIYFPPDVWLNFAIQTDQHSVEVRGKIARVMEQSDGWLYGVWIEKPTLDDKQAYFQLVYDRSNQYLPKKHDVWLSPLDGLIDNLIQHFSIKKPVTSQKIAKFPIITMNESIEIQDTPVKVKQFDFQTMVIESNVVGIMQKKIDFLYKKVVFKLTLSEFNVTTGEYVYLVDNLNDLIEENSFHDLVKDWSNKG
ncbi:glycosyltransferase [Carnobacterium sp.]|uniref:glycosyltransferase n=1 Tax=Carnobacterium sp. TaxID=48221 RepID=UPI00388F81D9